MNNVYESPLSSRYASKEMLYNFSSDMKFSTWRRLWVSLAKAEMALGLPITQEQVDEMEAHITDIDYDVARQREKEVRHDVMAHVYTFGKVAPKAAGIIHLGATSAYVGDNTDIIQIREGLLLVRKKLATVLDKLAQFADAHKAQPTLGFTHFQPAQLTTVGKRATLWMNELLMDLGEVEYRIENLRMLGSKGTTGTQASFMELFDGDESKVKELEKRIADDFGFAGVVPVSGQTYSRKIDAQTLATLAGIAESASKFATDLRLLQKLKTGCLLRAACELGCAAAGKTDTESIAAARAYGDKLGLAFQIEDDILDIEGDEKTLGKSIGKDAASEKSTFPSLLGLDACRKLAGELTEQAVAALTPYEGRAFLETLARSLTGRKS